jgi:hypothetical protein
VSLADFQGGFPRTAPGIKTPCERSSVVRPKEETLADSSGGVGMLGVLVGALIVVVIGGGLLFASGKPGNTGGRNTPRFATAFQPNSTADDAGGGRGGC